MNTKHRSKSPRPNENNDPHTPTKRAKTSNYAVRPQDGPSSSSSSVPETQYSHEELWKWTLTADAVAPCRIKDILEMQECKGGKAGVDPDFFWIGRIPCRTVEFYGLVVGVQTYENRTVYSVDDGSGCVDCNLRHSTQLQFGQKSPQKPKKASKQAGPSAENPPPKPIAHLGDVVRVVGRVLNRHQTRLINVERLERCRDANVEPRHWLRVADLHRTWYHALDAGPFVIPQPKVIASPPRKPATQEGSSHVRASTESPSRSSVASSAPSSPGSVASSMTSASQHEPNSPPRLRHPTRLHTRDLTANTFRIYLKHYMDNAPLDDPRSASSDAEGFDDIKNIDVHLPATPTKRRVTDPPLDDATPRPNRQTRFPSFGNDMSTPRLPSHRGHSSTQNEDETDEASIRGYTLSHLRHVPELALMARRVVDAEAKRRVREERKKQKEQAADKTKSRTQSSSAPKMSGTFREVSGEPRRAKMKRLFTFAIRQLYDEGSIILWDGPVRRLPLPPIPAPSFMPVSQPQSQSQKNVLWRMNSSHSTVGDSTVLSSVSQLEDDDDDGAVSDPPPNEEAYIPLTPSYFANVVEQAIRDLVALRRRERAAGLKSKSASTSGPGALEIARSMRKRVDGPTPVEIAEFLKKRDGRWRRVGEWAVKEALQWAGERGRVWDAGGGKWEICG